MPTHTLITFLGKAEAEYDSVDYEMEDGTKFDDCNFLSFRLPEYFSPSVHPIDRVIVLGTNGSSWDLLYTMDNSIDYRNARYELAELVRRNNEAIFKDEQDLRGTRAWEDLEKFLKSRNWQPGIIGYGESEEAQVDILRQIDSYDFQEKDIVSLDITHGLRHLPMLAVLIALYLRETRKVIIGNIYYGAYELWSKNSSCVAPVLNMKGLLKIADWVGALKMFEHDGDYGVFCDLLKTDSFQKSDWLKNAAFSEQVLNLSGPTGAINRLRKTYEKLEDAEAVTGISKLFKDILLERVGWWRLVEDEKDEAKKLYLQQRKLAFSHLDKHNYIQATIFAVEACISSRLIGESDYSTFKSRNKASESYAKISPDFKELKKIRNRLAHASVDDNKNQDVSHDFEHEDNFREKLMKLLSRLLPEEENKTFLS